jgi:FeS assembly SUF system protein
VVISEMTLKDRIIAALRKVYDPEMPVNIYELGLIYGIEVDDSGAAIVRMTLTAPNCPVAGTLPGEVERAVHSVPGVTAAKIELTFDPPWSKDRMSEAAKLALGLEDIIPIARLSR